MADRIIHGTLDTFNVDTGSEITYKGPGTGIDRGLNIRSFEINPAATGNHIVNLKRSTGIVSMEIFQDDSYTAASAPTGYTKSFNVAQAGKGKGAIAVNVTDASKNYLVQLTLDGYSEVSYDILVEIP